MSSINLCRGHVVSIFNNQSKLIRDKLNYILFQICYIVEKTNLYGPNYGWLLDFKRKTK